MPIVRATQLLNFFQTTRRVFYWSSILALTLALFSFPVWLQIFTEHNLPVSIRMAAPGSEYVRVYWDKPKLHPTAYEQIAVNPISSQLWQVKIEVLTEKNPQSKGTEVWVLDISTPEGKVDWSLASMTSDLWGLRNDPNGPQGKIAVASSKQAQPLTLPLKGGDLTIKLLRHPWSGKVRVTANNQAQEVDLFATSPSTETLTFPVTGIGDERVRNYTFKAVDTPWHRLKFVAEGGIVRVEEVKARDRVIIAQPNEEFILPFRFWNRFSWAIVSTVISFFWMLSLFVSAMHLWQGQFYKRFGDWAYIICLSVTLGGFWTLVFYPALMSPDSLSSWKEALTNRYTNWHPPLMALLMRFTVILFGNRVEYYTFLQAGTFYFAIFYLLKNIIMHRSENLIKSKSFLIASLLLTFYPVGWIYSVTLWKDVLLSIFCIFLASFLLLYFQRNTKRTELLVASLFLGLAISVRHNAIFIFLGTIIAVLSIYFKTKAKGKKLISRLLIISLIICSSLLYSPTLNWLLNVEKTNVSTNQLSALLVGYIKSHYDENGVIEMSTKKFLDRAMGEGTTYQLIKDNYECGSAWVFLVNDKYDTSKLNQVETTVNYGIKGLLAQFILNHPVSVIKYHLCVIDKLINLSNSRNTYWYHTEITSNSLLIKQKPKLVELNKLVLKVIDTAYSWGMSKHWFFLLLLALTLFSTNYKGFLAKLLKPSAVSYEVRIILPYIGISYFLSLCIVPVAFDWRYLLTPTLLAAILLAAFFSDYILELSSYVTALFAKKAESKN